MKSLIIMAFTFLFGSDSFANANGNVDQVSMSIGPKSGRPVNFADGKSFISSIRSLTILDSPAIRGSLITDTKYIHARALKDFRTRFGDTTSALWFSDSNGFTSYFMKDGFNDRVYYDKDGHWQYSLIYFAQDKFPANLRRMVKSDNGGLDIDVVVEVQTNYGTAYMVYLGNQSGIRILKMNTEGEMETVTDLKRG